MIVPPIFEKTPAQYRAFRRAKEGFGAWYDQDNANDDNAEGMIIKPDLLINKENAVLLAEEEFSQPVSNLYAPKNSFHGQKLISNNREKEYQYVFDFMKHPLPEKNSQFNPETFEDHEH